MNSPRQRWTQLALAWALWLLLGPSVAQTLAEQGSTGHLDLQIASEWSQGQYGDTHVTRIQQSSLSTRYRGERWQADIEVPWLRVKSPVNPSEGSTQSGLGDVWLKLRWEMLPLRHQAPGLDLVLKHKTSTGDIRRGMGTGGRDWALQLDGSMLLGQGYMLFGHLGHRRTGDVPGYKPYRNPWYAELGVQGQAASHIDVGSYYTTRQAIGLLGPVKELTAYCSWHDASTRMQAYATRGMATASPDWAAGLIARQRF